MDIFVGIDNKCHKMTIPLLLKAKNEALNQSINQLQKLKCVHVNEEPFSYNNHL